MKEAQPSLASAAGAVPRFFLAVSQECPPAGQSLSTQFSSSELLVPARWSTSGPARPFVSKALCL